MPNFGVNDNDRRTAEAMERIWAARRKEQVMSEVLTEEQIKAFRATGSVACGDGINTQYVAPDARKMILNTIDHWRQRAEQAEADRDAARKLCEDDMTWMHDERCSACGHRLRFSASHCPQCRAPGVPDWKLPKELPDICECERCVDARSALGRAK